MSLQEIRNKILEKVSRFDFLIDGEENDEDAGPFQLLFTDGSILEMELASDGESVEYSWTDKINLEKEAKKAGWYRIALTDIEPYSQLQRKKVTDFDELLFGIAEESQKEMVVAGLGFKLENGLSLVYYNGGDFAKIYVNEMPPPLEGQFKLEWKNGVFDDIMPGE